MNYPTVGYTPTPPPQKPSNGLAVGGFIVALIGFILSLIPIIGTVSWLLSPVGLILSAVGIVVAGRRYGSGRGLAITGVILGVLGIIMCIVYTVAVVGAVSAGAEGVQQQSSAVHNVTYRVETEDDSNVTVSYSQSQNGNLASGSAADVDAPWTVDTQVQGFLGPNVTASLSPDIEDLNKSDTITCTIVEDGVEVSRNSATGANASVSCMRQ